MHVDDYLKSREDPEVHGEAVCAQASPRRPSRVDEFEHAIEGALIVLMAHRPGESAKEAAHQVHLKLEEARMWARKAL
ncbi:MAG: hypothetical protein ACYCOR_17960 [Acidobacteriaceae bacterium]